MIDSNVHFFSSSVPFFSSSVHYFSSIVQFFFHCSVFSSIVQFFLPVFSFFLPLFSLFFHCSVFFLPVFSFSFQCSGLFSSLAQSFFPVPLFSSTPPFFSSLFHFFLPFFIFSFHSYLGNLIGGRGDWQYVNNKLSNAKLKYGNYNTTCQYVHCRKNAKALLNKHTHYYTSISIVHNKHYKHKHYAICTMHQQASISKQAK